MHANDVRFALGYRRLPSPNHFLWIACPRNTMFIQFFNLILPTEHHSSLSNRISYFHQTRKNEQKLHFTIFPKHLRIMPIDWLFSKHFRQQRQNRIAISLIELLSESYNIHSLIPLSLLTISLQSISMRARNSTKWANLYVVVYRPSIEANAQRWMHPPVHFPPLKCLYRVAATIFLTRLTQAYMPLKPNRLNIICIHTNIPAMSASRSRSRLKFPQ